MNDSDSNNFRNGTSGHLLFNPTKPGRVSRANDENNPRLSYPVVAFAPNHGRVCTEECNAAPHIVPLFIDTDFHCCAADKWKTTPAVENTCAEHGCTLQNHFAIGGVSTKMDSPSVVRDARGAASTIPNLARTHAVDDLQKTCECEPELSRNNI